NSVVYLISTSYSPPRQPPYFPTRRSSDLYDKAVFDRIALAYRAFASEIGITHFTAIPISGFKGDNITALSENTPWFKGPALIEHLESVELSSASDEAKPFRLPVQWVNRPNLDFRGFSGQLASGTVKPGDAVRILPS